MPLDDEELAELDTEERAEYDAAKAKAEAAIDAANAAEKARDPNTPIGDVAATALRSVVFPPGAEPSGELSFETPADRGETEPAAGEPKAPEADTKPAGGETTDATDALEKGAKKKRGRKSKKDGGK